MTPTSENYFRIEMMCLKMFGYSFTGNESKLYRTFWFLYFFSTFVYLLLDAYELTKHDDINEVTEVLIYVTALMIMLAKGFVLYQNRAKIGQLITKLHQKPFVPDNQRGGDQEAKILEECLWVTKLQTSVYYFMATLTIGSNILYVTFRRLTSSDYHDWTFAYGPFTALNVTRSPSYEISSIYQNLSLIYCGSIFISTDLLLASILAHISYQFKILQNYIRQLVKISYNEMVKVKSSTSSASSKDSRQDLNYSSIPWTYLKTNLKIAVRYHLAIIDIADEVENLVSNLLLLTFSGTLGLLCCIIYTASISTSKAQLAKHSFEVTNSCLQVLTVCFWGEQVVQESELVGRAAYESNFVGTDLRFQKSLAFIIRRSQNTVKITAGKFNVISLATFAWILRTSYSAFMVLLRANANKT